MKEAVIDTNIIVYAFDRSEFEKRTRCKGIIGGVFSGDVKGVITNQILSEFYSVITNKIEHPISLSEARDIILGIINSENWTKFNYNEKTVLTASKLCERFKIDFWDSLIAATMIENNIFIIYTENDKDFGKISELEVINPLK